VLVVLDLNMAAIETLIFILTFIMMLIIAIVNIDSILCCHLPTNSYTTCCHLVDTN